MKDEDKPSVVHSIDQIASRRGRGQAIRSSGMTINGDVADIADGHFAQILHCDECKIVDVFKYSYTDAKTKQDVFASYFWDDPEEPVNIKPLMMEYGPVDIGDYASVITSPQNVAAYEAIIDISTETMPDPLYVVRAIYWIRRCGGINAYDSKLMAKQAIAAVVSAQSKAREAKDRLLNELRDTQVRLRQKDDER